MKRSWSVLALMLVVLAACGKATSPGSDGQGLDSGSMEEIFANLSQTLKDEGSARFEFTSVSAFSAHPTGAELPKPLGKGLMDFKDQRGTMSLDFDGEGTDTFNFPAMEQLFTKDFFFSKIPQEARSQLSNKEWIKVPREAMVGSQDPDGFNGLFAGLDDVKGVREGREAIRGEQTTRFSFELGIEAFLGIIPAEQQQQARSQMTSGGVTSFPGKIWIDDEGRPRRYQIDVESEGFKASISYELFDFGVKVDFPSPDDEACFIVKDREEYQRAASKLFSAQSN